MVQQKFLFIESNFNNNTHIVVATSDVNIFNDFQAYKHINLN